MAFLPYPRSQNNSPTDGTDFHRFTGAWEVPQNSQNSKHTPSVRICEICGRTSSASLFCRRVENNPPTDCTDLHRFTGAWEVPQNTQNSQNSKNTTSVRICEICGRTSSANLFCEFCGRTPSASLFCRRVENNPPTDYTDLHRFTGAWEVPQNTQNSQNYKHTPSVRICEICGRTSSTSLFCEFCEFCGRTPSASLFCEFREFCGGHPLQVCSVNSENSVGEHPLQVCFVGG